MQDAILSQDSLLTSLAYMTAHFGHARSPESLAAGLPIHKQGMTLQLFREAAERIGFQTRVVRRYLSDVPSEVFPCIAVTKSKKALIILSRLEQGQLKTLDPVTRAETTIGTYDLEGGATSYLIYLKPVDKTAAGADLPYMRHWFWGSVLENKPVYIQVLAASLLINIFALTSPVFVMNFYNRVLPNDATETGWVLSIGAASIFIFDFIVRTLRGYFIDTAGRRSDVIVTQKLFHQVLDMRLGARGGSTGAFANSMREFDALREFLNAATMTAFVDLPFSFLFIVAIWMIGGVKIALMLMALYLLVAGIGYFMQMPVHQKVHQAMKTAEHTHGLLVETISNVETIRGVSGEGDLRSRYSQNVARAAEAGQESRFYSGLSVHFSILIQQLSGVLIVLLGMYLVRDHEMSIGALIAAVLLGSRAIAPIGQVASLVNKYHQAKSAFANLDRIMQLPVERPREKKFLHRPDLKGAVRLKGVSFTYPHTTRTVLQDISFSIQAGEKVGIVGRVGSGKSSLIKLLVNFYEPSAGTILVDDTDMRQIDPADLRRCVAYMGQDTGLMSGTIRSNITMGRQQANDEEVLVISQLAGVHDFVRRHPMGYDAPVGERGEGLSGGQRQAVALARTLLMDTPVLIIDEPTNAMDSGTEDKILRNMQAFIKDKTFILVTHKPALLKLVDRLILLDQGRIVADGPRDQVLEALATGKVKVQA